MNARLPLNEPQERRVSIILAHLETALRDLRSSLVDPPQSSPLTEYEDPRAAYGVWNDGEVSLRRAGYDVEKTVIAYGGLGLQPHNIDTLAEVLRTGGHLPLELLKYGSA
jgi:hypothetical protein